MRILGAIDLGEEGDKQVAEWTGTLAERLGATADLLYVSGHEQDPDLIEARRNELSELMDAWPEAQRGQPRIQPGAPVEAIIGLSEPYDAVVVGPRSRSSWERLFLGTVAAQVVRKAECPVFVCRGASLSEIPRLLVGLDVKRSTPEPLMDRAQRWVELIGGRLDAVFVDTNRLPFIRDATVRRAALAEQESIRLRDKRSMDRLLARLPEENRGEAAVVEGVGPGEKLVEMSEDYDLLVVGSLERMGVVQHLLGSVAEYVVSRAKSNVLTFPATLQPD